MDMGSLTPWVYLGFPIRNLFEVMKVIWHPNSGLSCNSRGDSKPGPKSNHTASTLAPRTIPGWHLLVPTEHLDKPLFDTIIIYASDMYIPNPYCAWLKI